MNETAECLCDISIICVFKDILSTTNVMLDHRLILIVGWAELTNAIAFHVDLLQECVHSNNLSWHEV